MKLITLAAVLMLAATSLTAQDTPQEETPEAEPSSDSGRRQSGPDHPLADQSTPHHRDSTSRPGEHSRFRSGRLRVLALDRSGQSRLSETHQRGRQHQRRPGLRIRENLFLPCLRAARPTASCRSHRQCGRERSEDFTRSASARLCGPRSGGSLSTDGGASAAEPPEPRRPKRISRSRRSSNRPRRRSALSGPTIPRG